MSTYLSIVMGVRTIAIADEVYERLRSLKRPDESFSKLLSRLVGRPSLLDLAGAMSPEQANVIRRSVDEGRARSRARRERLAH